MAAPGDLLMLASLITVTTALYLAPTIIAALRQSRWTLTIMSLNMLAGWTIAGWLIALVWAVRSGKDESAATHQPELDASASR